MTTPAARSDDRSPPRRGSDDRGAANSLTTALLAPLFVLLAFAALQAALWSHARTEARVIARDTAALVARSGMEAGDARAAATGILERDTDLRAVSVTVGRSGDLVRVTIAGRAPGILRGTTSRVRVVEVVPVEGVVP